MTHPIFVTRPHLPSLADFLPYLEDIWRSRVLTNGGKYHEALEQALAEYLGVPYVSLCANGTLALILALQALDIKGEVITTPFTFIATTHALNWNGLTPVFCDVEPEYLTLDPQRIEAAITSRTAVILPVHVYGYPCQEREIQTIAKRHGIKVIYDAAHTFGATLNGNSLASFGDAAILSFHATKVFNTFEGGAVVCHDHKLKQRIDHLRNFGFEDETTIVGPGINAKMNEFQAALGLLQMKYIEDVRSQRAEIDRTYRAHLANMPGVHMFMPDMNIRHNYAYFPVLIGKDYPISRDALYEDLKTAGIHARRYFYPLVSTFPMYAALPSAAQANLPVATQAAEQILCLPIYPDLTELVTRQIVKVIADTASVAVNV